MKKPLLLLLLAPMGFLFPFSRIAAQTQVELAGKPAPHYPFFHWVQNVNADQPVTMAIDGRLFPSINATTADVYVVYDRSATGWAADKTLTDVTAGGAQTLVFAADSIQQNIFELAAPGELIAYNALTIGVAYDMVIDMDRNGQLSAPDFIDGADGAGFYVVHDITQPGALAVTVQDWTLDTTLAKRIWYPTDIASMGQLPLIVISHGWTYNYKLYDYMGEHLASYGYIVMSHWNDVGDGGPTGTQSASLSLIANINHLLAQQDTLLGGVLNGKIDHHHMGWMGHSTGGESPVRAYTRLHDGTDSSAYFSWQDVQYISSFCPVSWFSNTVVNPYNVNYHQFLGGADNDVSGAALNTYTQPLTIYERGTGNKHVIYVHGAGHGVFNTDSLAAEQWVSGPDLITRAQLYPIVKGYLIAMTDLYCKQNPAGKEFFTRSYSEYRPMNTDDSVVISNEYRDAQSAPKRVIDDFETNDSLQLATCGAAVFTDLQRPDEILMKDLNSTFIYYVSQPSNGMTRARYTDAPHCLVMEWDTAGSLIYTLPDSLRDFSGHTFLSFRVCQRTRHPMNVALDSTINFSVSLVDEAGDSASIMIADYGPVVQTYQRDGGWQNEFCTVRIRLSEFLVNASQVDLNAIERLQFFFGSAGLSPLGALGIDDIELVNEAVYVPVQVEDAQLATAKDIFIYPNPSSGDFVVLFPEIIRAGELQVFSLSGAMVYHEVLSHAQDVRVHLQHLQPGMYLVNVYDGERYYCSKVMVGRE